jgi:hypothetical protein
MTTDRRRRWLALTAAVGLAVSLLVAVAPVSRVAAAPQEASARTAQVRVEASFILACQDASGAIRLDPTAQAAVWPDQASMAALGLIEAGRLTHDGGYVRAAWRWLAWYAGHLDAHGHVNDYAPRSGRLVDTGHRDSTDAYAGLWLLALEQATVVSRDTTALAALRAPFIRTVKSLLAVQDTDGLTWASPEYHVKYLMDESASWAGLVAAVDLARRLGAPALAARARGAAARLRAGVARLWDAPRGSYDWAVHADGVRARTDWSILYPDALEQIYPVAFGLVTGQRARAVVTRFVRAQPHWAQPGATARFYDGRHQVGWWSAVGWALERTGVPGANAGWRTITDATDRHGRRWPFDPQAAGELILLGGLTAGVRVDAVLPSAVPR